MPGIPWSPGEAASVNEFLSTEVGRKWLGLLLTRKPRIDLSSTEKAAMTGAYAAGYESFFGEIAMSRVTPSRDDTGIKPIDVVRD